MVLCSVPACLEFSPVRDRQAGPGWIRMLYAGQQSMTDDAGDAIRSVASDFASRREGGADMRPGEAPISRSDAMQQRVVCNTARPTDRLT